MDSITRWTDDHAAGYRMAKHEEEQAGRPLSLADYADQYRLWCEAREEAKNQANYDHRDGYALALMDIAAMIYGIEATRAAFATA